ncbi:putative oxidoreductase [Chlamydiales bacterium STE3]|nr:putative oxidoreductase [Chlamydiales bacterium STE3]
MQYKLFGENGFRLSKLCLGTMPFGENVGWGTSKEQRKAKFNAFINASGNHFKNRMHCVEASLKRLNTNYIGIYWLHIWDFTTLVEEAMRAFDELMRSGKVPYIGFSNTPSWVVAPATTLTPLSDLSPFEFSSKDLSILRPLSHIDLKFPSEISTKSKITKN